MAEAGLNLASTSLFARAESRCFRISVAAQPFERVGVTRPRLAGT
jgi:hypothetical protein